MGADAVDIATAQSHGRPHSHHHAGHSAPAAAQPAAAAKPKLYNPRHPERFGVGMDINIVTALVKALLSGMNRLGLIEGVVVASQAARVIG